MRKLKLIYGLDN